MKEFVGLRAKIYSFSKDNNDEDKKTKVTKKSTIKHKFKSQDYKSCLEEAQIENRIKHLEKHKTDVDGFKRIKKDS